MQKAYYVFISRLFTQPILSLKYMPITCLKSNFNVLIFVFLSFNLVKQASNRPVIGSTYDKPCNTFDETD